MKKRSWEKLEQIDKTRYILRTSIIVLLFCLIFYIVVLQSGIVGQHDVYRGEYAIPMILVIVALIIEGFYLRSRYEHPSAMYHLAQYLMLGVFTIALTGFTPSIYLFWLIWLILTAALFNRRSFILAIMYMFAVTLLTFLLDSDGSPQQLGSGFMAASIATVVAVTVTLIAQYTGISKRLLERTKHESDLRQNQLLTTINAVREAIIAIDTKGYIRVYNPAAMILFDTNAKLEGKKLARYLTVVDSKKHIFDLWRYIKKENRSFTREDLSLIFADGDKINLAVSCVPIIGKYHHGEGDNIEKNEGFVLTLEDITNRKSLDDERDEFISVIGHELRTPVAVTEGALSNIQYLIEQEMDPKTLSAQLKMAHDQISYLEQMINDISTLSRAQKEAARSDLIDVQEFINAVGVQYTEQIKAKGLELILNIEESIGKTYSSRLYLQEILQNLIANAIKYTKRGSITVSAVRDSRGTLVSISDTGIGISKSDQKHVFDKFFRSEDFRTRETGGTGLGLYVVAKLATLLKLRIQLESELNKGSTFSFILPPEKTNKKEAEK